MNSISIFVRKNGGDSLWQYFLLALLGTAGFFYVNLAAAFTDGLIGSLGFSSAQAGAVLSANIYGSSLGGLIAVFLIRRFHWRPMLVALLCGVLALELASLFVPAYKPLLMLRAVDGLIGGASVGVALSLLARTHFPDRAFGMLLVFQFAFGGLGSWVLPELIQAEGTWVLFTVMAVMDVAAIITAVFLRMPEAGEVAPKLAATSGKPTSQVRVVWLLPATLLALFLFQAAQMGLFAFIIPLAKNSHLTLPFITQTVGVTTWIGALGAVFVIAVGTKLGRVRPLGVAMVVALIGISGLYLAHIKLAFFAANALSAITWSFVVPYLFGMASALDRSGRMATLAGFMSGLGLASGPLIAGWLVRPHDYVPVISMALALLLVAAVAMTVAAKRVDKLERVMTSEEA